MKKSFKKMVAIFLATATMAVSVGGLSAGAFSQKGVTYKQTSGGSGGSVNIRSRVYTDHQSPYAGVNVYYYGVISDVYTSSTLITSFNLTGALIRPGSSTPIGASGTSNSVRDYRTSSSNSSLYTSCTSKTTTSSSAYGTSSQECNYPF